MVEAIEPSPEGTDILIGDEFFDLDQVPYMLPKANSDSG
jgi:hypothetical protein